MPIKLPKGFARRKSSGNTLDEVQAPAEPSFRVFERPNGGSKSFDGTTALNRLSGTTRDTSLEDPHPDNIFAGVERPSTFHQYVPEKQSSRTRPGKLTGSTGSGGTNNSSSTGKLYDSSSSAKFSSSSTLPSDNSTHDIVVPPIPESPFASALRAAGRTFSFGGKAPKIVPPTQTTPRHSQSTARERALTASTASTATPPRLLESDLKLDTSDDFSNIFEGFDNRRSQVLESSPPRMAPAVSSPDPPPVPPKSKYPNGTRPSLLSPIRTDRPVSLVPEPSPSDSHTSKDGLMESGSPKGKNSSLNRSTIRFSDENHRGSGYSVGRDLTGNANARRGQDSDSFNSSNATLTPAKPSMPTLTVDSPRGPIDPEVSSMYASDKDFTTVPLNHRAPPMPDLSAMQPFLQKQNDQSLSVEASLAARYEEVALKNDGKPNKIMTPAQFERYRQQQELTRQQGNVSDSESSDNESEEEEEDEAEKKRQVANQRKKQEAHLSVYRQQMMKITGEQMKLPNLDAKRESLESGTSPPNLNRLSILPTDKPSGGKSDEEDDEEIPLAILAAHGFPAKNRPPSQLPVSNSNPNLRASYMLSPPSVAGDAPPQRKTLPVFARNLPQDPYYGAGLVNQTNRESLALGGGTPSVYGGSTPNLPPGGLVGVIANEERARAMRRNSPNAQVSFDMPANTTQPNGMPTLLSQIGAGQQNGFAQGDSSQIQVSQQMTQMMQMQIQWMQQMMQMQSMQLGQPMPMPMPPMPMSNPNLLQPPGPNQRPASMFPNMNSLPGGPPQSDQRTLSMLDPSSAQQWNRQSAFFPAMGDMGNGGNMGGLGPIGGPGYAASVAPSERSNVGNASRYRPVSTIQPLQNNRRASTFTSSTPRPWSNDMRTSTLLSTSPQLRPNPMASGPRPVSGLVTSAKNANDEDDDDQGWAEMAKDREKKKSGWRFKKGSSTLGDLFHSKQI